MSFPQGSISQTVFEQRQIQLKEKLGSDFDLAEHVAAFSFKLEDIHLDGLGVFHVFITEDPEIGCWAIDQSQSAPEAGTVFWAEEHVSDRELLHLVRRYLDWQAFSFISQETGDVLA